MPDLHGTRAAEVRAIKRMRSPAALAALLLLLSPPFDETADAASAQRFRGDYTLSFLGFTVARATFESRFENESYAVEGSVSASGLAALFYDTSGTIEASGSFASGSAKPARFRADYRYGDKPSSIEIRFKDGDVTRTSVEPPPKARGADWIPLAPGDLRRVADPIASTVLRADRPEDVCTRTVRMYDGELRADLRLAFVATGKVSIPGYEGATVVCRMDFDPVSGYRKGKRALDHLKRRGRITVAFAPLGTTGVYAPVHATVATEIGTLTVRARRFEAAG